MFVQLGAKPQADFDHPIELMMDCHRRVEHFLRVLSRIAHLDHTQGLSDTEREALRQALDYFQSGAPRHHEDEELSLFPRLRASGNAVAIAALAKVEKLEHEHAVAKPDLDQVDAIGRRWIAMSVIFPAETAEFRERVERLLALYTQHIRCEDTEVFAIASHVLTADDLAAIGREMADRRRLNPGRAESKCGQRRRALQL